MRRPFRPGGPARLAGRLHDAQLLRLFGAVIIRGTLCHGTDCRRFASVVRCLDGDAATGTRTIWTDDGAVRINANDLQP